MRGGYGTSDHGTLADRQRSSTTLPKTLPQTGSQCETESRSAAGQPSGEPSTGSGSPARHCRVDGEPSLLVEWRRSETGWEGRVISVLWIDAVGWASVERWLPVGRITR
jgi:hypothetical protein